MSLFHRYKKTIFVARLLLKSNEQQNSNKNTTNK